MTPTSSASNTTKIRISMLHPHYCLSNKRRHKLGQECLGSECKHGSARGKTGRTLPNEWRKRDERLIDVHHFAITARALFITRQAVVQRLQADAQALRGPLFIALHMTQGLVQQFALDVVERTTYCDVHCVLEHGDFAGRYPRQMLLLYGVARYEVSLLDGIAQLAHVAAPLTTLSEILQSGFRNFFIGALRSIE